MQKNNLNRTLLTLAISLFTLNFTLSQIKSTVKDRDGNTYKVVKIGNQTWMGKNLNVSKFENGDEIPEARTPEEWEKYGNESQPAWCYYEFNPKNSKKNGKLYNWFAVNDPRGLAPEGFEVASDQNWKELAETVKSSGKGTQVDLRTVKGWELGKSGRKSTNFFGFSCPASGVISSEGSFKGKLTEAYFWTRNEDSLKEGESAKKDVTSVKFKSDNAYYCYQRNVLASFSHGSWSKKNGLAVRCIQK